MKRQQWNKCLNNFDIYNTKMKHPQVRRREKRQRSKEFSSERSSYLSELMKEGRMRCDEEGTGKVTRMDSSRIRNQDKVSADKRKDTK